MSGSQAGDGRPEAIADVAVSHPPDDVPRRARILVAVILVLLVVPGVIGFEAWPLTGWRLFSVERRAEQDLWVIEAVDAGGDARVVSLEELPLRYRHAAWPMRRSRNAPVDERDELCLALLDAVRDVAPATVELRIDIDHARLVERDGDWELRHDLEVVHACTTEEGP